MEENPAQLPGGNVVEILMWIQVPGDVQCTCSELETPIAPMRIKVAQFFFTEWPDHYLDVCGCVVCNDDWVPISWIVMIAK